MEKRKLDSDKKLINVLFGVDPLDWSRRDDGTLVFLNQVGQKFVYSPEELAILQEKALQKKDIFPVVEKRVLQQSGAEVENKPRSHHKKA
jgi:hypothetical protein